MSATDRVGVVFADASLTNLIRVDGLPLLGRMEAYDFLVPQGVVERVRPREHRVKLDEALESGDLRRVVIDEPETLQLVAELRNVMGKGQAACLALAITRGWIAACDGKESLRAAARERLGERRIFTSAGIVLKAIQAGLLTVEEADQMKITLESHGFWFRFQSFGELL